MYGQETDAHTNQNVPHADIHSMLFMDAAEIVALFEVEQQIGIIGIHLLRKE